MKKLLICLVSMFISVSAFSEYTWKITKVPDKNNKIVGYIYHTGAVGTLKKSGKVEKSITGLRIVCSATTPGQEDNDPVVVLYWDGMTGYSDQMVIEHPDKYDLKFNKTIWNQEGPILARSIARSPELMKDLKIGKSINFMWDTNDAEYSTIFDLRTFNSHLAEFNALCKTEL